jgi:hypothetical protein
MNADQAATAHPSPNTLASRSLRADLALVAFLIALDVAARLLPHAPNWSPVAATALFAGTVLWRRGFALVVPLGALLVSDLVLGFDHWAMIAVVYVSLTLPAALTAAFRRLRAPGMFVPVMAACSLVFFAATNFAVWASGDLYPHTLAGLATCFVAALPFLQHTVIGDLLWAVSLFGGAWLVLKVTTRAQLHVDARGGAAHRPV